MIPKVLHRTVPADTTLEVEAFWATACGLHPDWVHHTWRDPLDPDDWPLTAGAWDRCGNGAQRAGLIRLEAVIHHGGIYCDSDLELFRPLTPLLPVPFWATWEDNDTVPDFVFGAEADHPLLHQLLGMALGAIGKGAWESGPGVFTKLLPNRDDVLLLPPQAFAPYHYTERQRRNENHRHRYTFGAHHWHASWLS